MTAIERTAYPHLISKNFRKADLKHFQPTREELKYMRSSAIRSDTMQLNFILQLKTYQRLGYFINVTTIPKEIIKYVRQALHSPQGLKPGYTHTDANYRHRALIRQYLNIDENNNLRDQLITQLAGKNAQTMNSPADIINVVLEELIKSNYELPAFSTLDRTVCSIRHKVNNSIFNMIKNRLKTANKLTLLTDLLVKQKGDHKTPFNHLKRLPQKPTVTRFKALVDYHDWLMSFGDFTQYFHGASKIKLAQFSEEARSLNASMLKEMKDQNKKFSLIACLLAQAHCQTKDALALTFSRSILKSEKDALRYYLSLDKSKDETAQSIAEFLLNMTTEYQNKQDDKDKLVKLIKKLYESYGGSNKVIQDCEKLLAKENNRHLIHIWNHYCSRRTGIFAFLSSVSLGGFKQNKPLFEALELVKKIRANKNKDEWLELPKTIDLSFASKAWLPLIVEKNKRIINTHHLEVCVMAALRERLAVGDIYIQGADAYGDYRKELMPLDECASLMDEFCDSAGIKNTGKKMAAHLKNKLTAKIKQVDKAYPHLNEFTMDENNVPILKKRPTIRNPHATELRNAIKSRMPERSILDVMCLAQQCTDWAHYFSPASGSEAKLANPIAANVVTTFGYGTGMGPSETARHVRVGMSEKTIAAVNKSHVNLKKLNKALAKIVNYYKDFPLIKAWGTGDAVSVDGTLQMIYEQNLLAETHIRYGAKGGIAYHYVSDTYIALFSSLIPCGVWEAIAIIEGLLQNESSIKPKKVYGDSQSQSTPVFGLSYLFGIHLNPRIRNWKDLIFYKPNNDMTLTHINPLFKGTINWGLIEDYWMDMMQIVLSIQHGRVSSKLILSKLNSRNKSSQLYKAFQELGNVIRTLFLLDFISDPDLRETITAETNKVESYNNLSDWIRFASEVIVASNNTTEMEKAIKYNTLVTNMIILQNVIDMSRIIQQLRLEGWSIRREDLARLSPYLTEHLKRFGDFILDLSLNEGNIDKIKLIQLFS